MQDWREALNDEGPGAPRLSRLPEQEGDAKPDYELDGLYVSCLWTLRAPDRLQFSRFPTASMLSPWLQPHSAGDAEATTRAYLEELGIVT